MICKSELDKADAFLRTEILPSDLNHGAKSVSSSHSSSKRLPRSDFRTTTKRSSTVAREDLLAQRRLHEYLKTAAMNSIFQTIFTKAFFIFLALFISSIRLVKCFQDLFQFIHDIILVIISRIPRKTRSVGFF